MKRMYWRPRRVSRVTLALVAAASMAGYVAVEQFPQRVRESNHAEKLEAARKAEAAFKAIREERIRRKLEIDLEADPAQTGLVGTLMTPITTNPGSLDSKQTSANPNFAALVAHYLLQAGVQKGDTVAVGYSGSFPAINIAVMCAIEALEAKPVVISSVASSQWGANEPEFTWLDMEKLLVDKGIVGGRSVAASLGGIEDRALGMPKKGRRIIEEVIAAHGMRYIQPESFVDSVDKRMEIYREVAGPAPSRPTSTWAAAPSAWARRRARRCSGPASTAGPRGAGRRSTR